MKADYDYLSLLNATSTYRCPSSHTHRQLCVCVCACLQLYWYLVYNWFHTTSFTFIQRKNFLMPSSANKTHTHTHTRTHSHSHSHSHCHSHSLRVLHSRICAQLRIHTFILELSSFIPSLSVAFSFHSLIPSFLIPSFHLASPASSSSCRFIFA